MQEKIELSKHAMTELSKKYGMPEDKSAYYNRYQQEVREAIEDNPKMDRINVGWKMKNAKEIVDNYNEDECEDYLAKIFIPGITFRLGEIIEDRFPICPMVGIDPLLQNWVKQIGTSSEDNLITRDNYKVVAKLLNQGNFPRNLKANNPEAIARTLLKYNIVTADDISLFMLMRGARPESAILVGNTLAKNIDMLQYLSNINAFSFSGEGFTDKTIKRISEIVRFDGLFLDNLSPFSRVILAAGYQFCRTQPLVINGYYNPRRYVHIEITNDTLKEYIIKGITTASLQTVDGHSIREFLDIVFSSVSFNLLVE
jgi:hypothetical protein